MDLAGAGELGQHAVRAEPQGKRPAENRRHRRRRASVRPRRSRGIPQREGRRVDPEDRPLARRASSSSPTGDDARSRGWVHHKFALAIDPASWAGLDRAEIVRRIQAAGPRALRPEGSRAAAADRAAAIPERSLADPDAPVRPRRPGRLGQRAVSDRDRSRRAAPAAPLRDRGQAHRAGPASLPGREARRGARRQARRRRDRRLARRDRFSRAHAGGARASSPPGPTTHSGSRSRPKRSNR